MNLKISKINCSLIPIDILTRFRNIEKVFDNKKN